MEIKTTEEEQCKWAYKVLESSNPETEESEDFINGQLSKPERATFKIAQDDRRKEKAHTVIIFDKHGQRAEPYNGSFGAKVFKAKGTNIKDLEEICSSACIFLNSLNNIQSINARCTLSNSKNPQEVLTIYYPHNV
ncbi:hypothetical protein [Vibrio lentus]|uniref:hypothetical protein n=1 Tax=Vibrio lentus TaxID=136468 RepID=UPI003D0D9D7D